MRRRRRRPRLLADLPVAWMICSVLATSVASVAGNDEAADPDAREAVVRHAYLMGTRATLTTLAKDRARGLATLERMLGEIEAVEAELSTWRSDTPLSAINRQPVDVPLPAPSSLCGLLAELSLWVEATGGAFDPAIGSLVAAWGLRQAGRLASIEDVARARFRSGFEHLRVQRAPCRVTRLRAVTLDAGGFGKGVAIDRVAEQERAHGTDFWMVDLGGQVAVGGRRSSAWLVAIAHPSDRDRPLLELRIDAGSLATSGGSVRDHVVGHHRIGHIVDPRTGQTLSRPESVTVWHERAVLADVLSTALYVMGPEAGLEWAEREGVAACFLSPDASGTDATAHATVAFRARFPPAPTHP